MTDPIPDDSWMGDPSQSVMPKPAARPKKKRKRPLKDQLENAPEVKPDERKDDKGPAGQRGKMGEKDTGTQGSAGEPAASAVGGGGARSRGRPFGEVFEHSPVTPLGVYGDLFFYIDTLGQLRHTKDHPVQKIISIFGGDKSIKLLSLHFPVFKDGERVRGRFNATSTALAMAGACTERGVWSPIGKVRGQGFWTDEDGKLIYHAGNEVLINDKWEKPGIHAGKLYQSLPPIPRQADRKPRKSPADEALAWIGKWYWRRPDIDPILVLGVIMGQMVGGALTWRPVTWLTAERASGKSEFQDFLRHIHGGEDGLLQAADATEAGIRAVVGYSSLPVALDELEPDPDTSSQKVKAIIKLARIAASGGQIFRGSSDQKGFQQNAYNCFLFSSILMIPLPAQDRSRIVVLELDRIPDDTPKLKLDPRALRRIGAALRRQLIAGWATWPERLDLWRDAIGAIGPSVRGVDNFATVLALADLALNDELPSRDQLANWTKKIAGALADYSEGETTNAEDMITHLLASVIDPFRRGEQWTVAQFIMTAAGLPGAPDGLKKNPGATDAIARTENERHANEILAKFGIRVRPAGHKDRAHLLIPARPFPLLCGIFEGTQWAGGSWKQAALRLPEATSPTAPATFAGVSSRVVSVPLSQIPGLLSFPADPLTGPSSSLPQTPQSDLDDFA